MLKNIVNLALLFITVQGKHATEPKIPVKPYDTTYMWADFALVLENYPLIAASNMTDSKMRDTLEVFIAPIKEFCESAKSEDVTAAKRKASVVGLLDQLANPGSFKQSEYNEDDWKTNNMSESVMKRETLSKLQKTRNDLYKGIKDKDKNDKATKQYQRNIKSYRDVMMAAKETEYSKMITSKTIDWDIYIKRYLELLKIVKSDPRENSNKVRGYFTGWLRDGDARDDLYEELKKSGGKKTNKIKKLLTGKSSDDTGNSASTNTPAIGGFFLGIIAYLLL